MAKLAKSKIRAVHPSGRNKTYHWINSAAKILYAGTKAIV